MSHFRPSLNKMQAYQPGEQPTAGETFIKLNTNENPYPPSTRALEALAALSPEALRRYPQPFADEFREAVAAVLDIDRTWILVGNGSDDLLTLLLRSVAASDRPVTYPVPTYSLYRTLAQIQDAPTIEVAFDEAYNLPVSGLVNSAAALTLVANPNSPSGTRVTNKVLSELATQLEGLLVVDEAYAEFATDNALALTRRFDNLVVLRSLSKSHSLAGLRLGFAVAQPEVIAGIAKVKDSYNVDAVAARVGTAAIRDTTHTQTNIARVCTARSQLASALNALGWRVWPSEANFLLVQPVDLDAGTVYRALKDRGILIRYFNEPMLRDKLRITVGTNEQNAELISVLKTIVVDPDSG